MTKYKICFDPQNTRSQSTAIESRNLDHDKSCALKCKTGLPVRAVDFYDLIKVGKIKFYTCVSELYRWWGFLVGTYINILRFINFCGFVKLMYDGCPKVSPVS